VKEEYGITSENGYGNVAFRANAESDG